MTSYCQLWLTCKNQLEASRITRALLQQNLVACVKYVPVTADFKWQDKIENTNEVLVVMDSRLELFEKIESVVKGLHSYETFVLQAVPLAKISKDAKQWLTKETNG